MEVRAGYKRTEVGVMPSDWDITVVSSILTSPIQNGVFNEPSRKGRGCKLINVIDLYGSFPIDMRVLEQFDANSSELLRFGVKHGDIFFTRSSLTADGIAQCNIYSGDAIEPVVFDCHIIRIRPDGTKADPFFIARYCTSRAARRFLVTNAKTTTMTTIDQSVIANLPVALPPLPEQRAIAAALSDVDALLGGLDRLIAKKRDLKLAAMQQLLTGQTRLPGFSGEWSTINMSKHATLKARIGWQSLTTEEYLESGTHFLVTGTDFVDGRVNWRTCHFVDKWRYDQDRNIQLRNGDVLLTKDGTIGKVGYVDGLQGPATLNSGVFVIRPVQDVFAPLFLFYVLASRVFDDFLAMITAGSTIVHLYQKDFVGFEFLAPILNEQFAIAAVLADMDAELSMLTARRDKTRDLKQAMMQELLTGKTRLVSSEVAHA